MLLVSSDRQTIHIFKLEAPEAPKSQTWGGYFASFVPSSIGGYWTQGLLQHGSQIPKKTERAFVQLALPKPGLNHVCALSGDKVKTEILIVSDDAVFCL